MSDSIRGEGVGEEGEEVNEKRRERKEGRGGRGDHTPGDAHRLGKVCREAVDEAPLLSMPPRHGGADGTHPRF